MGDPTITAEMVGLLALTVLAILSGMIIELIRWIREVTRR